MNESCIFDFLVSFPMNKDESNFCDEEEHREEDEGKN